MSEDRKCPKCGTDLRLVEDNSRTSIGGMPDTSVALLWKCALTPSANTRNAPTRPRASSSSTSSVRFATRLREPSDVRSSDPSRICQSCISDAIPYSVE
jgi:hypothetical protein